MKPCPACKNPQACAKAGACAAKQPKDKKTPASQKKTGRFYVKSL